MSLRVLVSSALASLLLCGCAVPPATGVIRMGDGLMKAPNAAEAERTCRSIGEPMRFIEPEEAKLKVDNGVLFRCD